MADDDESECPEEQIYFGGTCTCQHDHEDHGWGHCSVEGCDCEAGWEE